jgi:peptide-methionine (S)-S-oxide reductase
MNITYRPLLILLLLAAAATAGAQEREATAVFAGGCFWCMEKPFDDLEGVLTTRSGYAGGSVANPTYEEVTRGGTGHAEVVQIVYDPTRVSYEELLYVFWRNVDPFDGGGQFCDRGDSYRTAIFYETPEEARTARRTAGEVRQRFGRRVATEIRELKAFYVAEDYHQNYYARNPIRYTFYRSACGRDARLREIWGDEAGGHTK